MVPHDVIDLRNKLGSLKQEEASEVMKSAHRPFSESQ